MRAIGNKDRVTTKELICNLFYAIDFSDWCALTDIFDPDIVYERPGYTPFVGIDRLLQFYESERVIASGKHHIERIMGKENYGACWGRFIGVKKDGSPIDELFADTYSFNHGKIRTRRSYFFRPAI